MNLTAQNTAIVLDSTADLPDAAERFPNWRIVPLHVRFGDESFRDGVDLDGDAFYRRLRESTEPPATSQPTPGEFLDCYRALDGYERIVSLHVSGRVSGTLASAEIAAAELADDRVRAIDSETASASIGMLALAIQRRLERGTSDEEVDELVGRYRRERGLLFTVETLEFLLRGGRIGKARAFAGTLLDVRPILSIVEGEVVPVKRVRGRHRSLAELVAGLAAGTDDRPGWRFSLAHGAAPERAAELERLVRERRPQAELELVVELGAVIGTHAGPGTVAVFWFRDGDLSR
ncbi:MAG TPA: DegV family protein [Gaiellaceae bacterium]|nr:DegV family protein [Gaiellaceae bacterium]